MSVGDVHSAIPPDCTGQVHLAVFFHPLVLLKYYPDFALFCSVVYRRVNTLFFVWAAAFKQNPPLPPLPQAICTTAFERINSNVLFHLFVDV